MREIKYLYASLWSFSRLFGWCLFATSLSLCAHADDITELDDWRYDSSIQRSNFFSLNPRYIDRLEAEVDDKRAQFFWKLRFDSQSLQTESNINSQIAGANIVTKFNYKFMERLRFVSKLSLNLESGRTQDLFGDLEPGTGIYPREALIEYNAIDDILWVKAGLIQQRFFNEPLFVAKLPFMGVSQRLGYSDKRFDVGLRLQQMIPTSYTVSTRVTQRETTPNFFTESLEGTFNISRNNFIKGRLTHYRYENLPAIVAANSFIGGNTVRNPDLNAAQFDFGFDGWMTQLAFEQKITDALSAQVNWSTITNNEAPTDRGEAQNLRLTVAQDFGRWIVAGTISDYFIESDAVVSSYNTHLYGNNNRIGQGYTVRVESKDWGVQFVGEYIDANLLNRDSLQARQIQQDNQQTIYFAVETMYDIF
jgi:hypothetical protein